MKALKIFIYPQTLCSQISKSTRRQVIFNNTLRFETIDSNNISTVEWYKFNGIDWDKI